MGAVIYQIRPGKTVRKPQPTTWSPELLKRLYPTFESDDASPYQLAILKAQRQAGQSALAKLP